MRIELAVLTPPHLFDKNAKFSIPVLRLCLSGEKRTPIKRRAEPRLCYPIQQPGNGCVKPHDVLGCAREQLCDFRLHQTSLGFGGPIPDVHDRVVGLARRHHFAEPGGGHAMESIKSCQHVRAQAFGPYAERDT